MPALFVTIPGDGEAELHCTRCMYALTKVKVDDMWNLFHPSAMLKDGRWSEHVPVPAITTSKTKMRPVCDFCGRPHPRWVYLYTPLETVTIVEDQVDGDNVQITMQADEHWAACVACSNLIDEDRWDSLIDYVVDANADLGRTVQEHIRQSCGKVYPLLREQGKVTKRLMSVVP